MNLAYKYYCTNRARVSYDLYVIYDAININY